MALAENSLVSVDSLMENEVESQPKLKLTSTETEGGTTENLKPVRSTESSATQIEADPNFPLVLDHNSPVASESFSILRSRLLSVHKQLGTKSVVITSAEAGDGKTLVATNLAMSFGQLSSRRILLVDGDLRTGHATRILKLGHLPGLGDFLQGKRQFEAVIHATGFPSLSIAPTGFVPEKTLPEILEGSRWSEFIEQAKQKFDLIVVDSVPASAAIADLELLTAPCEAILVVVYMRQTHREALKRAAARLDAKKILGVIINNSNEIYNYDYNYYNLRSQVPNSPLGRNGHNRPSKEA